MQKPDKVLFVNAAQHFEKGKRQNKLLPTRIDKILNIYQDCREEDHYSMHASMERIEKKGYFRELGEDVNVNMRNRINKAWTDPNEMPSLRQKNVRVKGNRAIKQIGKYNKPLAEYLDNSIKCGEEVGCRPK